MEVSFPNTSDWSERDDSSADENIPDPTLMEIDEVSEDLPSTSKKKKTFFEEGSSRKGILKKGEKSKEGEISADSKKADQWRNEKPNDIVHDPKFWRPTYSDIISKESRPIDLFSLYFDDEVIQNIVIQTNLYAEQIQKGIWSPVNAEELKAFFGILLLMSVNPMHQFYLYWSSDSFFRVDEIAEVMSCHRFRAILNCLHVNDNEKAPKRITDDFDPLYKLRPLINQMKYRFQKNYLPSNCLSVDESMVLLKGQSSTKQCMPMKRKIKRGYKIWCLADSSNGYLLNFSVHEGKNEEQLNNVTLGEHVVTSLLKDYSQKLEGSQIYFDKFFSGTNLMENLKAKGILCCGTFRADGKNLPSDVKIFNNLKRGEFIWKSNGIVTITQWRDTKDVHILSNFHDPTQTVKVERKLSNGTKIYIKSPKSIEDYNLHIGGVEKFDQNRNAYVTDCASKKSWLHLFFFLFDAAVVNAFVQYAAFKGVTLLTFRLALGRQLTASDSSRIIKTSMWASKKEGKSDGRAMISVPREIRYNSDGKHHPRRGTKKRCRWCSTKAHEKRTRFECMACSVPLCVECFEPYHHKN